MISETSAIERSEVGFRLLYSLIFAIVLGLLRPLAYALAVFQLVYTFVTEEEPPQRTRELGDALAVYDYRILRYILHADSERPFPFSNWPAALEPLRAPYAWPRAQADARHPDIRETDETF